ncbi:MAG: PQQ-binding-like beta-propeller repeat protein [Planctomycetota bacterium]
MLNLFTSSSFAQKIPDWYRWRGPERNGISKEKDWNPEFPENGPKVLWEKSIGTGFSSITVSGNRVYTSGNTGTKKTKNNKDNKDIIYCLDAKTGKEIWTHTFLASLNPLRYEGGPNATPTVDGEKVYCFAREGDIFCFNAADGKIIWQKNMITDFRLEQLEYGYSSSPMVFNEMLILNGGTHGLAIDKNNGELLWKTTIKSKVGYSTPVFVDIGREKCGLFFSGDALRCINLNNGNQLWEYAWKTKYDLNIADPIVSADTVFISSGYGTGCALLKFDNSKAVLIWKNKEMRNHFNTCVLLDGYIYGFDEKTLKCLKLSDGTVAWSENGLGKGSLMIADKKLIILSDNGLLVTANATHQKFDKISEAKILNGKCWTVPVLSGGRIYARGNLGQLVCIDVRQ